MIGRHLLYFLYGANIIFHLVMAWMFCYRHRSRLKIYVSVLMLTIVAQYVKDLIFIGNTYYSSRLEEQYASSIDMLTLPMYAIVLVEACRPMWLNWSRALRFYIPFVVLMVAFWVHPAPLTYYAMHVVALFCAACIALWALRELPRFERKLKEEYSYAEYINLHWSRVVILLFFCLLMLWVFDSVVSGVRGDNIFLFNSLLMWIAACFCFYRQSMVINVVKSYFVAPSEENAETDLHAVENALDKAMTHLEAAEADLNVAHPYKVPEDNEGMVSEPAPAAERNVLLSEHQPESNAETRSESHAENKLKNLTSIRAQKTLPQTNSSCSRRQPSPSVCICSSRRNMSISIRACVFRSLPCSSAPTAPTSRSISTRTAKVRSMTS